MFGPGYRNLTLARIVEDPNFRESDHSYFVQAVDLVAFLLYQSLEPCNYMRRKYQDRTISIALTQSCAGWHPRQTSKELYVCDQKKGDVSVPGGILLLRRAEVQIPYILYHINW
jgi:hypothetical protein